MSFPATKKTLRCIDGVEMWQDVVRQLGYRGDALRYFVRTAGGVESFDRVHSAWERVRQLTGVSNTPADTPLPLPVTFQHWNYRATAGK